MPYCEVRWRPSGGRGEWEFSPPDSLRDRDVTVRFPSLSTEIDAELRGRSIDGKSRIRRWNPSDRNKLNLVPLVMAVARLPDPARTDKGAVELPLENKGFVISHMRFEVVETTATAVTLVPVAARIRHLEGEINLAQRLSFVSEDLKLIPDLAMTHKDLAAALDDTRKLIAAGINDAALRSAVDKVINLQSSEFGMSNSLSISEITQLPPSPFEDEEEEVAEEKYVGKEGNVLIRSHSYKERDRTLVKKAKASFINKHKRIYCECCGFDFSLVYGERGLGHMEAHHRVPIEELLPNTATTIDDLAMVCSNCHGIIHRKRPWVTVEELRQQLIDSGNHFFK